jgi:phosphate transport system permease protein
VTSVDPQAPAAPAASSPPRRQPPRRASGPRRPRRPAAWTPSDIGTTIGCALSAISLVWITSTVLTSGFGWFGFGLASFALFLVLLFVVTADQVGRTAATDRVATAVIVAGAVALLVPLALILVYVLVQGLKALRIGFLFHDQRGITPIMSATAGGGLHAIIGTVEQVGLALVWSLPLAMLAAIFLNESRSRWRRPVRVVVDAMSGLPSVIAGLFIYATLILPLAKTNPIFGYNGFMASLALAIIMVPTITRTVEVVLRLVPDGLREASLALGSSRARTVWSVVLPTARTGITTAVILGIARAVGETAPLLFTAFGYDLVNANPIKGSQESLPLFVYRNIQKPDKSAIARGFAGALVLMVFVVVLFVIARFIGRDRSKGRARKAARRGRPLTTLPGTAGFLEPEGGYE